MDTPVVLLGSEVNPMCPQAATVAILHSSCFWILQQKSPLSGISLAGLQGSSITHTRSSANLNHAVHQNCCFWCFVLFFFSPNKNFVLLPLSISHFEISFISVRVFYFLCMCTRRMLTAGSCRPLPISVSSPVTVSPTGSLVMTQLWSWDFCLTFLILVLSPTWLFVGTVYSFH